MSRKAEIVKDAVKKCGCEKPTFGTDPNDPWSAKANITETALLNRYLKSRGINPEFATKDTKVAHSKTTAFKVWLTQHATDPMKESVDRVDTVSFDIPLLIRMLEYAREDAKTDMDLHKVVEKLIKIRKKGTLTMKDYKFVTSIKEQLDSAGVVLPEDVFHGSTAATQMPFDGANNPDDVIPAKRKNMKEMSKSARIIKSLYKKKGVKEELYDHEKENKSVASYGKKPKIQTPGLDPETKEAPKAAAVLSGGKTMTGAPRDTIEIDPMMKTKKQAIFGSQKPIK